MKIFDMNHAPGSLYLSRTLAGSGHAVKRKTKDRGVIAESASALIRDLPSVSCKMPDKAQAPFRHDIGAEHRRSSPRRHRIRANLGVSSRIRLNGSRLSPRNGALAPYP